MAKITYNNGYYEGEVNSSGDEHGHGTFIWNNGEKYVGQFKHRKFHGQGTYYYSNGNKYIGQWANDKKNGKGVMYFQNGCAYDGEWKDDKREGYGTETYKWGYYEGHFKDDDWYGWGKEIHKNGVIFEGYYKGYDTGFDVTRTMNGKTTRGKIENKIFTPTEETGYATYEYDNGSYEGNLKNGRRHGYGPSRWDNGDVYDGEWVEDKKEGLAVYTAKWGKYEGLYKNDARHGWGKETSKEGAVYEGFWDGSSTCTDVIKTLDGVVTKGKIVDGKFVPNAAGRAENISTVKYGNGEYEGDMVGSKRHGYGMYRWDSGAWYEGNWVDDLRKGFGKFFWTDGSKSEGHWDNDQMNGYGVYYSANGSYYFGQWKDDNKYYGKQVYSWGSYQGYWKNKTWCGKGVEVVNGGSTFEGTFIDAKNATDVTRISADGQKTHGKIVDGKFISD